MRESTRNTISMLSDMWKRNSPIADFDAFALVVAKNVSTKERFDNMQKVISSE